MSGVEFRAGWRKNDHVLEADAIAFWGSGKRVLPQRVDPEARARELCAVAYRDGIPVGVSTATLKYIEQFRSIMAFYRCSVRTEFGHEPLSWRITDFSREVLERWSLDNPAEKVMGLMAVMQSKILVTRYPQVFAVVNMTFTGFTPSGLPIRVAWFKHATIPTEWPPRPDPDHKRVQTEPAEIHFPVRVKGW